MSRMMVGEGAVAWRAVITYARQGYTNRMGVWCEPSTFVEYAGPFVAKAAASSAISRAQRQARRWPRGDGSDPVITGKVQQSSMVWEDVA